MDNLRKLNVMVWRWVTGYLACAICNQQCRSGPFCSAVMYGLVHEEYWEHQRKENLSALFPEETGFPAAV